MRSGCFLTFFVGLLDPQQAVIPAYLKTTATGIALLVLLPVCGIIASNAVNPVGTARFTELASRIWSDTWPFPRGASIGFRLSNLFYDLRFFKPIRVKVEPGFVMELEYRDHVTQFI